MKKILLIALVSVILFSGCADVTAIKECVNNVEPYGFFGGLWHGLIVEFSFIGSLFWDDIAIYAVNNNGGLYDFGFLLGIGTVVNLLKLLIGKFN